MASSYTTYQIAPLAANAGLTQNIDVGGSPTGYNFGNVTPLTQNPSTYPGFATASGGPSDLGASTTSSTTPSWVYWGFAVAVLYFALNRL